MKKTLFVLAAVLALVAALGAAGFAYAQNQTPPLGFGGMMGGYGHMNGYGHMGGYGGMMNGSYGPMHTYMVDAMAEALDLDPEELQARIEAGESMWDIAASEGLSAEETTALMQSAHTLAVEQAVADGVITPEQAEWMNSHMQQMHGAGRGYGAGSCHSTDTPGAGTSGTNG